VTGERRFHRLAVIPGISCADTHARRVNIDKLTYAANLESLPGRRGNPHYAFEKQLHLRRPFAA